MITLLASALAVPTDPAELADAAVEADGLLASCRAAVARGVTCQADRTELARASLVRALAALVVDGASDPVAAADAWALGPEVAAPWRDLIGPSSREPSLWVQQMLAPEPVPATSPPPERTQPTAPTDARRWWSVAITGSVAPYTEQEGVRAQHDLRVQGAAGTGLFAGQLELEVGRDVVDFGVLHDGVSVNGTPMVLKPGASRQHLRQGRAYAAVGVAWTRRHHLRLMLGPALGSEGYSPNTRRHVAEAYAIGLERAPIFAGLELRGRGRLQQGRIAAVLELRSLYETDVRSRAYLGPDGQPVDPSRLPEREERIRNAVLGEAQVRLVRELWLTLGTRLEIATLLRRSYDTNRVEGLFVEGGLVWR